MEDFSLLTCTPNYIYNPMFLYLTTLCLPEQKKEEKPIKEPKKDEMVITQLSVDFIPILQPTIVPTSDPHKKEDETKKEVEPEKINLEI